MKLHFYELRDSDSEVYERHIKLGGGGGVGGVVPIFVLGNFCQCSDIGGCAIYQKDLPCV